MSNLSSTPLTASQRFELRFESFARARPALAFPCDADGLVNMDSMSPRARNNYLGARALLGHDYAYPVVCRV